MKPESETMSKEEASRFHEAFMGEAVKALALYPDALQVTLLLLDTGEILTYPLFDLNDGNAEAQYFDKWKAEGKTKVRHILTLWRDHTPDMPKRSVVLRILAWDKDNENACVLLRGENGINGFRLSRSAVTV